MLRSILSVCIMGLSGLLMLAVLLPTQVKDVAKTILSGANSFSSYLPSINSETKPQEEIKDPIQDAAPLSTIGNAAQVVIDVISPKKETAPKNDDSLTAANIVDATNKERIKLGLPPLLTNAKLAASAKLKTDDMIKKGYFEHVSPQGVSVSDLGTQVGYDYVIMGENLALGNFSGANDLLQAWMDSPGHRANIVSESYLEIGIYAAQGQYQGRKVWFAVQHFGTARGACPVVDQKLKGEIDALNTALKAKEKNINTLRAELGAMEQNDSEYQESVAAFNALVADYNAQLAVSQAAIARYNKQVVAFNKCLSQYQGEE